MIRVANLLQELPDDARGEITETLAAATSVRIERIASRGQASPPGFWYDQEWNEWVTVLAGAASLRLEGHDAPVELRPGDYLNIPAHVRHRVEWTVPGMDTIWLAVHYH